MTSRKRGAPSCAAGRHRDVPSGNCTATSFRPLERPRQRNSAALSAPVYFKPGCPFLMRVDAGSGCVIPDMKFQRLGLSSEEIYSEGFLMGMCFDGLAPPLI